MAAKPIIFEHWRADIQIGPMSKNGIVQHQTQYYRIARFLQNNCSHAIKIWEKITKNSKYFTAKKPKYAVICGLCHISIKTVSSLSLQLSWWFDDGVNQMVIVVKYFQCSIFHAFRYECFKVIHAVNA